MKTYTDHDGWQYDISTGSTVANHMHADLVAALEIARAYQAKCERLEKWKAEATDVIERWEAAYEVAGIDPSGNLGRYKSDLLADEIRRLHASEDELSQTVAYLHAQRDMAARGGER